MGKWIWPWLLAAAGGLPWAAASAADACADFGRKLGSRQYSERLVGVACQESTLWYQPFIDDDGHFAGGRVMEAESGLLADRVTPAWQRVAGYWRHGGVLPSMTGAAGASDCSLPGDRLRAASCRAFLLDNPWSAAFVSFAVARAGVPGFRPSASHGDYVRRAYREPASSPFLFADPFTTPASPGDLLCFTRNDTRVFGYAGLAAFFGSGAGDGGIEMHCDLVVGDADGGAGHLTLVGGNVMHSVTRRRLPVTRAGLPWNWPVRTPGAATCSTGSPRACNLNQQDWGVLLKLKSLPPALLPMPTLPTSGPAQPACCTACVVGAIPAIPRCPTP